MKRAKTFEEVLAEGRQQSAPVKKAATVDLSHLDFDAIANAIIREAAGEAGLQKAAKRTALDELQELVAARLQARPELTRQVIVGEIFQSNPGLYDRVRAETTVDGHGRTLKEIYDKVTVVGIGKSGDGESVADEVARRVETLVAKTAGSTTQQAMQFVFRQDPELYAKWRQEYA